MDKAARFFNWLGFIGIVITFLALGIHFTSVANGFKCPEYYNYYNYTCSTSKAYDYWHGIAVGMWIGFAVYGVIMLFVSIWVDRQIANYGNTIAAGIVALLFLGFIGGLLTLLCDSGTSHHSYHSSRPTTANSYDDGTGFAPTKKPSSTPFKEGQKYRTARKIYSLFGPIAEGTEVTVTEANESSCYGDVVLESGRKENVTFYFGDLEEIRDESKETKPSSEKEKIEILKEYKSLLDEGIISQKEFNDKKKELLSK